MLQAGLWGHGPEFQSLFIRWFIYKLLKMYKVIFGAGGRARVPASKCAGWCQILLAFPCAFLMRFPMLGALLVPLTPEQSLCSVWLT